LDVVYSKAGGEQLKMDVYPASGPAAKGPSPAVVMIHGGAWVSGRKEDMTAMAKGLSEKGFFVANIQYRLAPKHKWPAMLDDVQTAVRYLRTNATKYAIDPKRIGSCGASAGGHLAMFLGVSETRDPKPAEYPGQSSKVRAVFNFFGPCDMSQKFPPILDGVYKMVLGKEKKDAIEEIKSASPINFVDKTSAPMFIYQGMVDPLVNPEQARIAQAKYKECGIICEVSFLEGIAHEIKMTDAGAVKAIDAGVAFLRKHLGG
jgi:acetyl esterase/lipase